MFYGLGNIVGIHVFIFIHPTQGCGWMNFHNSASKRLVEPYLNVLDALKYILRTILIHFLTHENFSDNFFGHPNQYMSPKCFSYGPNFENDLKE